MTCALCIQELAELVGGRIRYGSMPPLGGQFEPVSKLVPSGRKLRKGDVVVSQFEPCQPRSELDTYCPDQSFSAGALGVISSRGVCPWSGKFSLQVENVEAAVWRYVQAIKPQLAVPAIAVLDSRKTSPVVEELARAGLPGDPTLPLAWQCLQWQDFPESNQPIVLQIRRQNWSSTGLFDNQRPMIAIVSSYADEELIPSIQSEEIIGNAIVVSDAPDRRLAVDALDLLQTSRQERIA